MNILLIGSGGREHAIAWKLSQNENIKNIFCAPGNGGTAKENKCQNVDIKVTDFDRLIQFAKENDIYMTVVGPEDPLALGIVDRFESEGLKIFGPNKMAAKIEASKAFCKEIMVSANIPTAFYGEFTDFESAKKYVLEKGAPIVVKADGLAAGKGVTVAATVEEAIDALKEIFIDKIFGDAGNKVVIEEFLKGEEASFLAFTDGITVVPMVSSQDHKPVYDNDKGPNTGGMGAYSPAPVMTEKLYNFALNKIAYPLVEELKKRNIVYKGIIYAGLMIDGEDVKVLEFNCRFGDPETQPLLMRLESDLLEIFDACINQNLKEIKINWYSEPTVCVVMASGGYPKDYKKGYEITGIDSAEQLGNVKVFHAGTKLENEKVLTNGGRVLAVTARGKDLKSTIKLAYSAVEKINFKDMHFRKDIAQKALRRL
ncbi:phosphoribosylamine--glycine ligase [Deferribacterales bacterium Es71-Z0220]|uniref:phosphoribosylamine--glycine ligase n=1 Tax=Deferrivibrio essentukiensis TaxID=2880922 RepID=UPI001F6187F1|nr:phosphoribosylamine--glycine ligase [Deferrivibrio essentukiensis]MCB4205039.1 phosphoribosylamine--glycine ligase [Deferrivibrio essentukiensis]